MDRRDFMTTVTAAAASTLTSSASISGESSTVGQAPPVLPKMDQKAFKAMIHAIAPIESTSGSATTDLLSPIDTGAKTLLNDLTKAQLRYSPLDVEYLLDALETQLTKCLDLREKAQELEKLAVSARLELKLERSIAQALSAMSEIDKVSARFVAGTMFAPKIEGSVTVVSAVDDRASTYWNKKSEIEQTNIKAHLDAASAREQFLTQPGSGGNHLDRFRFLKQIFDIELADAYLKARSIAVGAKLIYGIDKAVPEVTDIGFLSALAVWYRALAADIEKQLVRRTTTTIAVGLRKHATDTLAVPGLIADGDFLAQRATYEFKFSIPSSFFDAATLKLKRARLRGIEAFAWIDGSVKPTDYLRIKVVLPDQSVKVDGETIWAHAPKVSLPIVSYPVGDNITVEHRREVHNADPVGDWRIEIDKRTLTDKDSNKDEVIKNLFLVMRVASDWSGA